jgi:hypothetical protein
MTATVATGTRSGEDSLPDPLSGGECTGHVAYGYGPYIYDWPSKLDQVFWPYTDPDFIWHCPDSGLTAFRFDIEGLSQPEVPRVREYLDANYNPSEGAPEIRERLKLLEDVHDLLDKREGERIWLLRLLAYLYEAELDDIEGANRYRLRALPRIENQLGTDLNEQTTLGSLFLAERYQRLNGDPHAARLHMRSFLRAARTAKGDAREQAMYLIGIQREQYGGPRWLFFAATASLTLFLILIAFCVLRVARRHGGPPKMY